MKFQPDAMPTQAVQAHGPGWVQVAGQRISHSVLIGSHGQNQPWGCAHFADLTAAHFEQIAQWGTELVIFGSGERLRFAAPALIQALIQRQIGLETMDTAAACRTYNVLAAEGRHVALALLLESPTP
jgi:uncharacterized protein